jgi:hypothetical protein
MYENVSIFYEDHTSSEPFMTYDLVILNSSASFRFLSKNLKIKMYKTIILHLVLYGYKTWFPTLREVHKFRAFENRMLRRIFGPKREEVVGGWRRLHNEGLNNLYASCMVQDNL